MPSIKTHQLALFSVLAAACIAVQLSPRPVPNVEFTSITTFFLGVVFGGLMGGSFGALVMFINGFLSPWGFAGMIMPFQMVGMAIVGVAGGVFRRYGVPKKQSRVAIESAILGTFLTLTYDIITNIGTAIISGVPIIVVLITGVTLALIHIISNTIIFGLAFSPLLRVFQKFGEVQILVYE